MINLLLVGLGGFVGSSLRYLISITFRNSFHHPFPFATLVINVVGCFFIGLLLGFAERSGEALNPGFYLLLSSGLLGGFTTFSAFGIETIELYRAENYPYVVLNIAGSLILGIGAAALGRWLI